ncbi:MAG: hypothetical protein LC808_23625 [Actinobacteria bacterium]|nr:hypothetical protein [Actinomycetota bacterium]
MDSEDRQASDRSQERLFGYPWGTAPPGWTGAYNGQNEPTTSLAGPPREAWGGEKDWIPVSKDRWVWHEHVLRFDFEKARRKFPDHWTAEGWPASNSTWQAINYPRLHVRVTGRSHDSPFEGVATVIYWAGDLDGLRLLFTYWGVARNTEVARAEWGAIAIDDVDHNDPFEVGNHGLVLHGRGSEPPLDVKFERAMFGGPDTWQVNIGEALPFFEPVPDWDDPSSFEHAQ